MSEGVIKFRCDWTREPIAIAASLLADLGRWRARLREAGLIGVLPDGIGFGNVSVGVGPPGPAGPGDSGDFGESGESGGPGDPGGSGTERVESLEGRRPHHRFRRRFLITGSGTGGLAELDASRYAFVTDYDIEKNSLACRGLTQASSESLSHAAIYAARPDVGAVFHVHSEGLWRKWLGVLPTTDPAFEYGTPEIALAVGRLAEGSAAGAPDPPPSAGAVVLAGHRDGLMIFGRDLGGAGAEVLRLIGEPPHSPAPPGTR